MTTKDGKPLTATEIMRRNQPGVRKGDYLAGKIKPLLEQEDALERIVHLINEDERMIIESYNLFAAWSRQQEINDAQHVTKRGR